MPHLLAKNLPVADRPDRFAKVAVYGRIVPRVGVAINNSTYVRVRSHRTYYPATEAIYGLTRTEQCLKFLKNT